MGLSEKTKRAPSAPVWNQSFPSPRHCWSAAPSLSGAILLCHFSRAFPYPPPGDACGCRSAPASQLVSHTRWQPHWRLNKWIICSWTNACLTLKPGSRVIEGHSKWHIWWIIYDYDFLLMFNSNYGSILHHFDNCGIKNYSNLKICVGVNSRSWKLVSFNSLWFSTNIQK